MTCVLKTLSGIFELDIFFADQTTIITINEKSLPVNNNVTVSVNGMHFETTVAEYVN
jgi:hypothetical protein